MPPNLGSLGCQKWQQYQNGNQRQGYRMKLENQRYSLADVAEILKCDHDEIIGRGADGKLELFIRVPQHLDLYNVGWSDLHPKYAHFQQHGGPQAGRASSIDYLVVSQACCEKIRTNGLCLEAVFSKGASDSGGELDFATPACPTYYKGELSTHSGIGDRFRRFATYRQGLNLHDSEQLNHPQNFEITKAALFVSRPTLQALLREFAPTRPNVDVEIPALNLQPHTSRGLIDLHRIFKEAWSNARSFDFALPSKAEIHARLESECGFSGALARAGTEIVHQANLDRDENGDLRLAAALMECLIICSETQWASQTDESPPKPSESDITQWIRDRCPAPDYVLKGAARIIRPSKAPKGRRHKASKE
jgi:hypothetical protein